MVVVPVLLGVNPDGAGGKPGDVDCELA